MSLLILLIGLVVALGFPWWLAIIIFLVAFLEAIAR